MSAQEFVFMKNYLNYVRQNYLMNDLKAIVPEHYNEIDKKLTEQNCKPAEVRRRRRRLASFSRGSAS